MIQETFSLSLPVAGFFLIFIQSIKQMCNIYQFSAPVPAQPKGAFTCPMCASFYSPKQTPGPGCRLWLTLLAAKGWISCSPRVLSNLSHAVMLWNIQRFCSVWWNWRWDSSIPNSLVVFSRTEHLWLLSLKICAGIKLDPEPGSIPKPAPRFQLCSLLCPSKSRGWRQKIIKIKCKRYKIKFTALKRHQTRLSVCHLISVQRGLILYCC